MRVVWDSEKQFQTYSADYRLDLSYNDILEVGDDVGTKADPDELWDKITKVIDHNTDILLCDRVYRYMLKCIEVADNNSMKVTLFFDDHSANVGFEALHIDCLPDIAELCGKNVHRVAAKGKRVFVTIIVDYDLLV